MDNEAKVAYRGRDGSGPHSAYVTIDGDVARGTEQHSDEPVTLRRTNDGWEEI